MFLAKNSLNVRTSRPQLARQINVENEQTICIYIISSLGASRPQLSRQINVRKSTNNLPLFLVPKPVLGNRDTLVRVRIRTSDYPVMDPDSDPTPDPTPFFCDFKDAKKLFFSYFLLITYPQGHYPDS